MMQSRRVFYCRLAFIVMNILLVGCLLWEIKLEQAFLLQDEASDFARYEAYVAEVSPMVDAQRRLGYQEDQLDFRIESYNYVAPSDSINFIRSSWLGVLISCVLLLAVILEWWAVLRVLIFLLYASVFMDLVSLGHRFSNGFWPGARVTFISLAMNIGMILMLRAFVPERKKRRKDSA